jgi:hypothetical protein
VVTAAADKSPNGNDMANTANFPVQLPGALGVNGYTALNFNDQGNKFLTRAALTQGDIDVGQGTVYFVATRVRSVAWDRLVNSALDLESGKGAVFAFNYAFLIYWDGGQRTYAIPPELGETYIARFSCIDNVSKQFRYWDSQGNEAMSTLGGDNGFRFRGCTVGRTPSGNFASGAHLYEQLVTDTAIYDNDDDAAFHYWGQKYGLGPYAL